MSNGEDFKAELDRLRSENEALKKTSAKGLTLKVSEKGGVSVYGLGRFPVTLYKEQWAKLLDMSEEIRAFGVLFFRSLAAHVRIMRLPPRHPNWQPGAIKSLNSSGSSFYK